MDYNLEIRKFIYSQYVYTGLRITAGVLIPGLVLYHYNLFGTMISIPLGALFVALTDNPGPTHHRLNGMLAAIITNGIIVVLAGLSHHFPLLIAVELVAISMLFSLLAVYGNRANTIGLIALIAFILNINPVMGSNVFYGALYLTIGGAWYMVLSLLSNAIRPYQPVQQLLGECLIGSGDYLKGKALFYNKGFDGTAVVQQLMEQQVKIHEQQDELREIIFKTRKFIAEPTNTGRRLTMIFLDSIDLFERIMTTQQDYAKLHLALDGEDILERYQQHILLLAGALHQTGLAVQAGYVFTNIAELDASFENTKQAFAALRARRLRPASIETFIKLRHILYSLEDLTGRIKRLQAYTNYRQKISTRLTSEQVRPFIEPSNFDGQLLLSNISLGSAHFRHALRLAIALATGYVITLLFPLGHGYWILLTIATIVKPAYSISRKKNVQRVAGTMIGVALGFIVLSVTHNNTPIFIVMLFAMMVAYIFLRLQYLVSTAGLTLYVLLNFHFLYPAGLGNVLTDRLLDTVIGSGIAFCCSFIFPVWEQQQINGVLTEALKANANYFAVTADVFTGKKTGVQTFKLARKEAFVALANLSGVLQRMLSEPKSQRLQLVQYHQLATASHMLTSYIASLSYYAQRYGAQYSACDFEPMAKQVNKQFSYAVSLMENNTKAVESEVKFPVNKKVQQLLDQRKKELESGIETGDASARKSLSEMKTITDQFQLISSIVSDEVKLLKEIVGP